MHAWLLSRLGGFGRWQEDAPWAAPPFPLYIQHRTDVIRASVDTLCRDGVSEISRDPRTKRLLTRRESLARP